MRHPRTKRPGLARFVHSVRVVLVVALLLSIPSPSQQNDTDSGGPPTIAEIQNVLPSARSFDGFQDQSERWSIENETDTPIGTVVRTLPLANDVVGYRGPTEAAIIFDLDRKIAGVRLLQSSDTEDYVKAVRADQNFFEQFKGWPWGGPDRATDIDGVSGATLTSLALAEGVLRRIDGNRPSLLFPVPLAIDEIDDWFPDAQTIDETKAVAIVKDSDDTEIGRLVRTGPLADNITGYRGPTELLMKLDDRNRIQQIKIRSSYDNQPFTGWVRDEVGFWEIFENKTVDQLARFSPDAAGVEGVSGATMTSLAIADTIVKSAKELAANIASESAKANHKGSVLGFRYSFPSLATVSLLVLAGCFSRMHWFHHRVVRKLWLMVVVIVIGFWSGNLVSLALIAGWSAEGIAWQLAPGLAAITVLALIAPPTSLGNPYCNHLCPHGAIQQLIKPSRNARWHLHPSRRVTSWLKRVPAITLIAAYLTLITAPNVDLSSWEPFHAYLIRIAGGGAIAMALATLIIAAFVPMAYCRFGCPTGSLLDYLRRSARSDRVHSGDLVAFGLLMAAWIVCR